MERSTLTAAIATFLLVGCSSGTASLVGTGMQGGTGFTGVQTMNACVTENNECYTLEIESDGTSITRIHYPIDIWVDVTDSGCSNGYCWALDGNGAEWKMEP